MAGNPNIHNERFLGAKDERPKKGLIIVNDGETVYQVSPDYLIRSLVEHKARPEAMWGSPALRFIDREYVESGPGVLEPIYIVVTEQQPGVRTIKVQRDFDKFRGELGPEDVVESDTYQISLPYLINVFVWRVNKAGALELDPTWALSFYRTLPLTGFGDELLICNLPNVTLEPWNPELSNAAIGWTCFHNAPEEITHVHLKPEAWGHGGESEMSGVARATEALLNYYWDATFTASGDTISAWKATQEVVPETRSMARWEDESLRNPMFGVCADWLPHPERATLGDVVRAIHDATIVFPHQGFVQGEDPILTTRRQPRLSIGRLRHVLLKNLAKKVKAY